MKLFRLTPPVLAALLLTACGAQSSTSGTDIASETVQSQENTDAASEDASASEAEETEPAADSAEPQNAAPSEGYDSAADAYAAYLTAVLNGDPDAFIGLFSEAEAAAAPNVPGDFLAAYFGRDIADANLAQPEQFRENTAYYLTAMQDSMSSFGEPGDHWSYREGYPADPEGDPAIAAEFAAALQLNITAAEYHQIFFLIDNDREASASGKPVVLLEIDGKWYPSYTAEAFC